MRLRVALYARVSSISQAEKDLSIPAQLKNLKKYASERNMDVVDEFIDAGETGTDADRSGFQNLMASAKSKDKRFDAILVWKFNRAFRSVEDAAFYERMLHRRDVDLISITEPVSDDAAGHFQRNILHAVSQLFSEQLSQDIRRGLAQAASEGRWCRPAPSGYKIVKDDVAGKVRNRLVIDTSHSGIIREIFNMALAGAGAKRIACSLNERGIKTNEGLAWSATRIRSVLRNEHYTGTLVYGKTRKVRGKAIKNSEAEIIRVPNNHPAIVTPEEFERVSRLIASRNRTLVHPRTVSSKYILSSLLRCGCGSAMCGSASSNRRYYKYICAARARSGRTVCDSHDIDKMQLETAVLDSLTDYILTEENISELVRLSNESMQERDSDSLAPSFEAELKKDKQKLERYLDAIGEGDDASDLMRRIRETRQRITELERQLNQTTGRTSDRPELLNEADVMRQVYHLKHLFGDLAPEAKKSIMRSFIKSITVKLPEIIIQYSLPATGRTQPHVTCIGNASVVGLLGDLRQSTNG